jgi:copper chaperone
MTSTYTVRSMTCDHCVNSVTEELLSIMGVTDIEIDLVEGGDSTVRVTSAEPLDPERVREAINEAGYQLLA